MNENNPLTSLPGEIIQDHLGPCLTGIEIIGLSETCRRLYRQFNVDSVWREKTSLEGLKISPQIERIAKRFRDENYPETDSEDCIPAPSLAKLQYLVARMIQRNISQNNFRRETISFGSAGKVCCSEKFLVGCAEGRMLVWDTSELWTSVTNTSMEKRPFSLVSQTFHTEVNLAISGSVLLLCFSYSQEEGGEEYFQHIAAHHLENDLKLLWEKSGLLGGHLHTVKIINDNLFIFYFIADCIEVYRITEESLERETSLGPISSVGRITCDWVSASRRHLQNDRHLRREHPGAAGQTEAPLLGRSHWEPRLHGGPDQHRPEGQHGPGVAGGQPPLYTDSPPGPDQHHGGVRPGQDPHQSGPCPAPPPPTPALESAGGRPPSHRSLRQTQQRGPGHQQEGSHSPG